MAFKERIFKRPRAGADGEPDGVADATTQAPPDGSAEDAATPHELHDGAAAVPTDAVATGAVPAEPVPTDASGATAVMPAVDPAAQSIDPAAQTAVPVGRPGFRQRGRMRRRLRYLREVRELGYRDLGGLVFDQHRFGRPNEALLQGKVNAIDAIDRESRALGAALEDRAAYSELRVAGVSACQRCGGLHGSDAGFCPSCGLAFGGPRTVAGVWADHPVAPPETLAPAPTPAAITSDDPAPEPAAADPAP